MRIRILYLLFFILIFCNCNGQQVEKTEAGNTKEHTFQMVSVPSVITEPEERAAYLVKHYWDKFDFTDTTLIHFPEITDQLAASPFVTEWIKNNKLKILAVYPDEDLEAWKKHISYMPAGWINSYDSTVSLKNDEIYDLKAIPTLYLLDKDKKVVLKDVTFNQVENYLKQ